MHPLCISCIQQRSAMRALAGPACPCEPPHESSKRRPNGAVSTSQADMQLVASHDSQADDGRRDPTVQTSEFATMPGQCHDAVVPSLVRVDLLTHVRRKHAPAAGS